MILSLNWILGSLSQVNSIIHENIIQTRFSVDIASAHIGKCNMFGQILQSVKFAQLKNKMQIASSSPSFIRFGLLILLTVQNTATVLCMRASMINASASNQKYLVSTLVLTMEMIKVSLITALIVITQANFSIRKAAVLLHQEILRRPLDALPLAVPSILYVVQDNLIVYALSCVDATTYQVTYQVRILTTAFFARILLNKVLPIKRWLSLLLLMFGVILTQVNFHEEHGRFRSLKEDSTYLFGLLAIGFATITSGFAGVYNEKIIKNGEQPLLLIRSFQLSLFSVFFALMGVALKDGSLVSTQGYFYGYTPFVWLVATMQAIGGILVAGTMKYADNILKTFATSNSIVLSFVFSFFLLKDDNLTPTFIVGTFIIVFATFLYSVKTAQLKESPPWNPHPFQPTETFPHFPIAEHPDKSEQK